MIGLILVNLSGNDEGLEAPLGRVVRVLEIGQSRQDPPQDSQDLLRRRGYLNPPVLDDDEEWLKRENAPRATEPPNMNVKQQKALAVKFSDAIVLHRAKSAFKRGEIAHPKVNAKSLHT